jgi:Leucine-rich repeat (LRR) protein
MKNIVLFFFCLVYSSTIYSQTYSYSCYDEVDSYFEILKLKTKTKNYLFKKKETFLFPDSVKILIIDTDKKEKILKDITLFKNVEVLTIRGKSRFFPNEIYSLKRLKQLNIEMPNLVIDSCFFENLSSIDSLQYLHIYFSNIKRVPNNIILLKNLKSLSINKCNLIEITPEIYKLDSLFKLEVCNTSLSHLPDVKLPNLRILKFYNNKNDSQLFFYNYPNLIYLFLSEYKDKLDKICEMEKLIKVKIFNSNLNKFPVELFCLSNLQCLILGNCGISAIDCDLNKFVNLKFISLVSNPINEKTAKSIINKYPNIEFMW